MKSIIQKDKECYVCGVTFPIHEHHIFGGNKRKLSEKYGIKVFLCWNHHEGTYGVHGRDGKELAEKLHKLGQEAFEEAYPDLDFLEIFGKNYI